MKQYNAPENTKENMSVFCTSPRDNDDNVLCVSKYIDKTKYYWLSESLTSRWINDTDIGMWRLTKKRENKQSNWEKVLDSKITNKSI